MNYEIYRKKYHVSNKNISAKDSMLIQQVRKIINICLRMQAKDINCTVLSSDCLGGCILHDLGKRFNSPTVNLWFEPYDFIKFVCNLETYIHETLVEDLYSDCLYPVGRLGDIKVYFQHYSSFDEAKTLWNKRVARIQYDNIYVMMDDHGTSSKEDKEDLIKCFNTIPYRNKVFFTNYDFEIKYSNVFYIKGFEDEPCCGNLVYFQNRFGVKYYDQYAYIKWMKGKC